MSNGYQVIARKWRPQTFDDVVGQDHVVRTLKNAIGRNRIAHAYLFVGPRGTGKTSTARIFAKALNCTGGPKADFDPADPAVKAITEGTSMDVIEIDGASNNSVDQIRDLRDDVAPGHDPADVRDGLIKAIGDTGVSVSRGPAMEHASPSPLTPEVMGPIEKVTRDVFGPNVAVIPTMGTGATDSKYLRAVGIPGYGVSGLFSDPTDNRAHGRDERVPIKSYYDSQEFLYRLVKEMSSTKPVP